MEYNIVLNIYIVIISNEANKLPVTTKKKQNVRTSWYLDQCFSSLKVVSSEHLSTIDLRSYGGFGKHFFISNKMVSYRELWGNIQFTP